MKAAYLEYLSEVYQKVDSLALQYLASLLLETDSAVLKVSAIKSK